MAVVFDVGIAFCRPKFLLNIIENPEDVKAALQLMGDYDDDQDEWSFHHAVNRPGQESCIYGSGGFHRYWVQQDGTIVFSQSHSSGFRSCKDAQDLGFWVR